ncbi:tetratricopeptide repeat protein [Phaeobacter porticola]|uniref:TPR repeat protein n=1 Tax=Phaeobacter porticola TaxID=1844006 RepID=A0A1L3I6N8_9RHOB|nr:tetratricopeptide repeat protein [Phaeobacter porticola]APG47826.1 TPR repeat protein [Phaeobacter porticola]
MVAKFSKLKAIVAATSLTVLFSVPLQVQAEMPQDEAGLLTALSIADPSDAIGLDRALQALWGKSGSAAMDLLMKRGVDALDRGDTQIAIEHLTALTDHAPDFAMGWYERARAYFTAGLFGPAVADLERTLMLNPNDYNAIYALGAMFEQFNDPQNAYEAYQRAEAIHPHHEGITNALDRLKSQVEGKEL